MTVLERYQAKAALLGLAARNLGLPGVLLLKWQQARVRHGAVRRPYRLHSQHLRHPVWCRPGTTDASVFHQIFVVREYACLDDLAEPQLILDCGANVGYSSAYFLSRYPRAEIIAVEPDPDNVALLEQNLRPYGDRVRVVRSAVWSHPAELIVDTADGHEWSRRVRQCQPDERPDLVATDIATLLAGSGRDTLDLLKMDVEGAEEVIFSPGCEAWLEKTRNIVIELHGAARERAFRQFVTPAQGRLFQHEELTVFQRR
jgi:FkbM family methyltransferase